MCINIVSYFDFGIYLKERKLEYDLFTSDSCALGHHASI